MNTSSQFREKSEMRIWWMKSQLCMYGMPERIGIIVGMYGGTSMWNHSWHHPTSLFSSFSSDIIGRSMTVLVPFLLSFRKSFFPPPSQSCRPKFVLERVPFFFASHFFCFFLLAWQSSQYGSVPLFFVLQLSLHLR